MNASKVVPALLGVAAVFVIVVVSVLFFKSKGKLTIGESKAADSDADTQAESAADAAAAVSQGKVLHVVSFLSDSRVAELKNMTDAYLLDARAKSNYSSNGLSVTVAAADLEDNPGYTKVTHTLSAPLKGTEVVFDDVARVPFFEYPLALLTVYLWHKTVLFMSFKTVNETGTTQFVHYHASKTSEGLRWSRFDPGHSGAMDPVLLNGKLDELNTVFGNVVAVHLDEFPEAADGVYTSEFGGTEVDFAVTKRRFTQAGFMKVTHKLDANEAKPYKLKRVLVSDNELSDLVMPRRPVASVSVFWWYNMPLLAELELKGAPKEYFVYNLERNNWYNEPVDKVRSTLTLLKNSLGVPLTLDLGKRPSSPGDLTYKTNDVLVRVTGPLDDSPTGFSKYTHRFATGKSQFVGGFTNLSTPQHGLPFARVTEVSVFFSEDVPLLVQLHLAGSAALSTTQVLFSNNGFGFWSKVMLGQAMPNEFAVLTKLNDENNKLMAANDKYSLDLAMKSDYLTYGKLVKVAKVDVGTALKGYTMYKHNNKTAVAFKFEKFVNLGKEVSSNGVTGYEGVTEAKVYWFLDTPLLVHMSGAAPVPRTGGATAGETQGTAFNHYFTYDGETRKWNKKDLDLPAEGTAGTGNNASDAKLKEALDGLKVKLGSVTLSVGHGAGVYKTGPVTVTVTNATSSSKYHPAVFDKMTHEMSSPFLLGKLMHFDTPVKMTHVPDAQKSSSPPNNTPVDYPLDFAVYGMNVYVYKFVPLVVELFLEEGTNLLFKNTMAESKWMRFAPDNGTDVGAVLMTLKDQLATVSSLDVCRKHVADQAVTYQLPRAVGANAVQVTLAKMTENVPDGLTGVTHTLPQHEKLSSLTCGEQQLTGLNLEGVKNVAILLKNGVPTLVKTNSSPKYYTHAPDGGLKLHPLPANTATTGLTDAQVAQLATDVSSGMGSVFDFNLETKTVVNLPGSKKLKVENKHLKVDWVLFTHTVGEASENFTVSKFVKGAADAVGLPTNKLLNSVFVGMKGQVPKFVGLKTASIPVKYEWFVFDKNRWFFDFETDNELDGEELLAVLEDVEDGLENAFTLDLALDLTPEVFVFDHVKLADDLVNFEKNTYTVPDLKFPFWLQAVHFNSQVMVVPDLENHHLRSFTAYTYHGEPVLLHALTVDNKSLVFAGNFRGTFAAVQVPEFNDAFLKAQLLELKKKAGAYLALELKAVAGYKNYDVNVAVSEDTNVADLVFKKWVHKLPETQPAPGSSGAATPTPFALNKVKFNGAPLDLTMPEGTMTAVNVFMDVDLPLGFHMEVTAPAPKPAAVPPQPTGSGPTPVTTNSNTVSHHYVFFNDGVWAPVSQAAALDTTKLKEKLTAAKASVVKRVYVDLSKRVTYSTVVETVNNGAPANSTTTTTLSLLVEPDSKDVARLKAYTHVPKEVVVTKTPQGTTGNMVVQTTTKVLVPLVTAFKMGSDVLKGFDLLKADKVTVYWVDDSYPVLVNVKTAANSKFFKNNGGDKWALVKTVPASVVLTEVMLFELANFAGKGFNYKVSVELGSWTGVGNSVKYTSGQVTMRAVKSDNLGDFKVYTHTSASVFSPTFVVDELLLYGTSAVKPVEGVKLVHEVKVFVNADHFPLLAEVVYSDFKHPKAPLKYRYFKFNQDLADGTKPFVAVEGAGVKMPDADVLKLLEPLKAVKNNVLFVNVDAKTNYVWGSLTLTVAHTPASGSSVDSGQVKKFDLYDHTFTSTVPMKALVLVNGTKRVGFAFKAAGYKSVAVHWLKGMPVHVGLKYDTNQQENFYYWDGVWTNNLGLNLTDHTNNETFYGALAPVYDSVDLDVGKKTLTNQFGVVTKFDMENFKPRGWELPDGLVGYSLLPERQVKTKVAKLMNFGVDLGVLNLLLPEGELVKVNVYSPDWFYAPLLVQFVTKVTTPQVKNVCRYFHVTSNGVWSHLDTNGDQLDGNTLALRLANVSFPAPVMVDVGKRGGVYGVSKLMVEKSVFKTTRTYTRYVHKMENGDSFLVSRWLFGGLSLNELPVLKANHVAVYFYDHVPLLVEVNSLGLVKFFAPDADGHWLPDGVNAAAVAGFLDNLWHELSLFAKVSQEWVPHLNTDFVREMELVSVVAKPVVSGAATPSTAPSSLPAEAVDRLGTSLPQPGTAVPPGSPAASGSPAPQTEVSQQALVQPSTQAGTERTVPVTPPQTGGTLSAQQQQQQQQTRQQQQAGAGTSSTASVHPAGQGQAANAGTSPAPSTLPPGQTSNQAVVTQPTLQSPSGGQTQTQLTPGAQPQGTAAPAATAPQQPLVPPVTPVPVKPAAVLKTKRQFKPLPFDYDELFHGYVTMGKMVRVSRFFTVPYGYYFARHSFYKDDKYFADKFRLGVKEYPLPKTHLDKKEGDKKSKSLGFYSWAGQSHMLKLGFDHRKPAYFIWKDNKTEWVELEREVVNVEEELEHLNSLNNVFVFDLGAGVGKHYHTYFNNRVYQVTQVSDFTTPLYDALDFTAFEKVQPSSGDVTYNKVLFKVSKLRLNGLDFPSEGLPVDSSYNHMVAFMSKTSNKPLMLVFYRDLSEEERKKFEAENPGKFNGDFYRFNVDGTWSKFMPEGTNDAFVKDLNELEALLALPWTLDLGKVTGAAAMLNYKANKADLVVERVFVPEPRPVPAAPPAPVPGAPGTVPPPGSPQGAPNSQGTPVVQAPANGAATNGQTPPGSVVPANGQSLAAPTAQPGAPQAGVSAQANLVTSQQPTNGTQGGVPATPVRGGDTTGVVASSSNGSGGSTGSGPQTHQTGDQNPSGSNGLPAQQPPTNPVNTGSSQTQVTSTGGNGQTGVLNAGQGTQATTLNTGNGVVSGQQGQPSLQGTAVNSAGQPQQAGAKVGGPAPSDPSVVAPGSGNPPPAGPAPGTATQAPAVNPNTSGMTVVETLTSGLVYVDVNFVAHPSPVAATEPEVGFEMYHHHHPYFVHRVAKAGATPSVVDTVKVKKFNLKKLVLNGADLVFERPFEPVVGGWAGMTVFYQKKVNTPFAFALFNPVENSGDLEKVAYDVWVYKNHKWVKTDALDAHYKLMRSLDLRAALGPLEQGLPAFYQKLQELAAEARGAHPRMFALDLAQQDKVKFGSVTVEKKVETVNHVPLVKVKFQAKSEEGSAWVDFTLDGFYFNKNKLVGLNLPMPGVQTVEAYFRNPPAPYANYPQVLKLMQKLLKDGEVVVKYWFYGYMGFNEWNLMFVTEDALDDWDVLDLVNAKVYEYTRLAWLADGALVADLDMKFPHVSNGRYLDAHAFVYSPGVAHMPVPEGFVLYRFEMETENATFLLKHLKLQGEFKPTGFKLPLSQYFVYHRVGYATPFVVVFAQANNRKANPAHHWYYVNGFDLVKFKFTVTTDVDPDNATHKETVANKFKELLKTPPTPLTEADPLVTVASDTQVTPPTAFAANNRVLSRDVVLK